MKGRQQRPTSSGHTTTSFHYTDKFVSPLYYAITTYVIARMRADDSWQQRKMLADEGGLFSTYSHDFFRHLDSIPFGYETTKNK